MAVRLIVYAHYTPDDEIELNYRYITEDSIDETIEKYLAELGDGIYMEDGEYDKDISMDARKFFRLCKKGLSIFHCGLPTACISKVYSIIQVSYSDGEESDDE